MRFVFGQDWFVSLVFVRRTKARARAVEAVVGLGSSFGLALLRAFESRPLNNTA